MSGENNISCDNAFISLALQNILQELYVESPWHNFHALRIQVVMAKNMVDELAVFSDINIADYDIILCTTFFHSIVVNFFSEIRGKFICVDSDYDSLKRDIKSAVLRRDNHEATVPGYCPVLTFTRGEMVFISDYLSCLCAKQIARKDDCGVKSVSNRKRVIMMKVNSQSNLQFWVTLKFLMFFDHPSLRAMNPESTARGTRRRVFEALRTPVEHRAARANG